MGQITVQDTQSELHPVPQAVPGSVLYTKMDTVVANYWGGAEKEKRFVIAYWRVRKLMEDSPSKMIALKITDVEEPTKVDGDWVSFNADDPASSGEPSSGGLIGFLRSLIRSLQEAISPSPDVTYFAFGEDVFPLSSNSLLSGWTPHHEMIIIGRLGRGANNKVAAYFVPALPIIQGSSGGSGGASSGAKIPSGDPDT